MAEQQPNKSVTTCFWHGLADSLLRASGERSSPAQPIPVVLVLDDPDLQFSSFASCSMTKSFSDARKEGNAFQNFKQSFDVNVAGKAHSKEHTKLLPMPLVEFTPTPAARKVSVEAVNSNVKCPLQVSASSPSNSATLNGSCVSACLRFDQLPDRLIAACLEFTLKVDIGRVSACSHILHDTIEREGRFVLCGAFRAVKGIERLDPGLNPQLVSAATRTSRGVDLTEHSPSFELVEVIISRPKTASDDINGTKAHFIACPLNGPDPAKIEVLMQDLGLVPLEYIVDAESATPFARSPMSSGLHGPLPHRVRLKKRGPVE